jgi:hypothetical protein
VSPYPDWSKEKNLLGGRAVDLRKLLEGEWMTHELSFLAL